MIRFRCRCDEHFEVPAELAGTSLQCPNCGLLVDVPTIDDLPGLEAGGTYKLHEVPLDIADEPSTVRKQVGAGGDTPSIASRNDASDRRMSLSDFLKIGTTEDDLLQIKGETQPGIPAHPKYDPVTGELIVPLEVREDKKKVAAAIPIPAAPAVLGYERKAPTDRALGIWWPLTEMFRLPNLLVCLIVTAMHYLNMVMLATLVTFFFPVILSIPILLMTISHFANVIDETGPTGIDEIPRPMRGASLYDDFLRPLVQVFFAYFLAWLPIILINRYIPSSRHWQVDLGLTLGFYIVVPALLITLITSGAINNLLPSRALSVITAAGKNYWAATIVGIFATYAFILATVLALNAGDNINSLAFSFKPGAAFKATPVFPIPFVLETLLAPLVMFIAVYLVHVFCWQLGIIYRRHHDAFNWVLQKHDKSSRTDTLAQLHLHRQRELEAKAQQARKNMEQRAGGKPAAMPVAKPVSRQG